MSIGDSFHTIGTLPAPAVWRAAGVACTARHCRSSRVARGQNLSLRHLICVGVGVWGGGGLAACAWQPRRATGEQRLRRRMASGWGQCPPRRVGRAASRTRQYSCTV
jgi:hypothetical protein